jgi:hypothetical protein
MYTYVIVLDYVIARMPYIISYIVHILYNIVYISNCIFLNRHISYFFP